MKTDSAPLSEVYDVILYIIMCTQQDIIFRAKNVCAFNAKKCKGLILEEYHSDKVGLKLLVEDFATWIVKLVPETTH